MITVAIQAGGQSERMGRDKALLPLGDRPLIQHVLDRVAGLGDEILITTNRPEDYTAFGARLASDVVPGAGALAGLHTALSAAWGETILVLACDMPFVSRPLLAHLLSLAPEADVVAPRPGGEYEPLHAVYACSCLPAVEAALQAGEERVISFYSKVRVRAVEQEELAGYDPAGLSFFNINSPEDLTRAEEILAGPG
jgi:molybdopterin-guanine dinucleotide biosynthesis protein A